MSITFKSLKILNSLDKASDFWFQSKSMQRLTGQIFVNIKALCLGTSGSVMVSMLD